MIKVIHTGDLHLGGKYPDKAQASIEHMLNEIETASSLAHDPDLFLCTGDSTEKALHVHSDHLKPLLELIHAVEAPKVFLQGTPSHEPYGFLDNLRRASGDRIIVMDKPQVMDLNLGNDKYIALASLPALTRITLENWAQTYLNMKDCSADAYIQAFMEYFGKEFKLYNQQPNILLGHWTVNGCKTSTGQTLYGNDLAVSLDDIALAGADATLLGHIHMEQEWYAPNLISYCTSSYPCNWGERDPKSFSVLKFDDKTYQLISLERIPFPHKPMVKIEWEFTGQQKDGDWDLLAWCPDLDDDKSKIEIDDSYEVKVAYSVPKELAPQIDDMYVRMRFKQEHGFDLSAIDRVIRATNKNLADEIAQVESTRDQYLKVCEIRGEEARPGALEKCDHIDEEGIKS